jgi:hypothetical protein
VLKIFLLTLALASQGLFAEDRLTRILEESLPYALKSHDETQQALTKAGPEMRKLIFSITTKRLTLGRDLKLFSRYSRLLNSKDLSGRERKIISHRRAEKLERISQVLHALNPSYQISEDNEFVKVQFKAKIDQLSPAQRSLFTRYSQKNEYQPEDHFRESLTIHAQGSLRLLYQKSLAGKTIFGSLFRVSSRGQVKATHLRSLPFPKQRSSQSVEELINSQLHLIESSRLPTNSK